MGVSLHGSDKAMHGWTILSIQLTDLPSLVCTVSWGSCAALGRMSVLRHQACVAAGLTQYALPDAVSAFSAVRAAEREPLNEGTEQSKSVSATAQVASSCLS